MTTSVGDSGWMERLRRIEADVARHESRLERIELADQQDVIVERLNSITEQLTEAKRELRLLRNILVTLSALIPLGVAIVSAVKL